MLIFVIYTTYLKHRFNIHISGKNNNILSKSYCEKVCASLARSNIKTTLDAMNYLKQTSSGRRKEIVEEKIEIPDIDVPIKKSGNNPKQNKKEQDEEWDSLMAELEEIGDGNDGKA